MEPHFKSDESQQFFREKITDGAVYVVYLKKIQYNTSDDLNKGSFHNHPVLMKCCQIGFVDSCKETEHVERLALLLKTLIYQCQSIQLGFVEDKKARLQWRLEESCVIKCGRLDKLVEAMCSPSGDLDSTFVDTLLATYRSFASSKELIEAIIKRYTDVGDGCPQQVRESCRRSLKMVLLVWLDMYPEDFREPPIYPALTLLETFAHENYPDSDLSLKTQQKRDLFLKQEEGADALFGPVEDLAVIFRHCILDTIRNAMLEQSVTNLSFPLDILSIPSKPFAEQLTFMDAELFRKVIPYHCLGSVWSHRSDKKQVVQPVTVYATVDQFNAVSHRVIATVLKWPYLQATERASVIEKWIDIAQECRLLKNFSSLKAIISGLQSSSVYRLKAIWQVIPREKLNLFKELANIFNEENNHSLWRELLSREGTAKCVDPEMMNTIRNQGKKKSANETRKMSLANETRKMSLSPELPSQTTTMQGTVPYLGTFLTDLMMVDTAFKDFVQDDLVNFEKKRKEFELMAQIQMLQSSASLYHIEPDHIFFDWFYSIRVYDANESHELSHEIEPSDGFPTVDRRTHRKRASLGYFATRRPASMEDLHFFHDSMANASKKQDEDSKSITSMQEFFATNRLTEFRHSISMCSVKSFDGTNGSMPLLHPIRASDNSLLAKVFFYAPENHQTNNYKSIRLSDTDHAHTVLQNVLVKYNIVSKSQDYVLFQLLPNGSEMPLPDRGNIFYAIKKDVGDVKFVVRKRTEHDRYKLKHTRAKSRLSKFLLNM